MLNSKSFLAGDFGAANLKVAEFELNEAGGLLLTQYGFRSLGQEGLQEASREAAIVKALPELLAERSFQSRSINVCAPGFHTFSKFVKLPPVDTSKVTQIIQYEAQQNVPFPLEEVVWDYQILGAAPSGELEVLLVAIKSDIVEGLFRIAEKAGLRLQLVDVSAAGLCNAFRYNYPDLQGCTMLLDIGAKTSNLLFFEGATVYSRGINIGANSITQDFSREARLAFEEAERLKIEQGFVSLGGAYEEPENAQQAQISKIARQVMTRLHIQVNQTIQFYRGQQGGSAPQRLLLAGGASLLPYTAEFFSEKLNLPPEAVEYFNPLRNVALAPALNREELAKVAHMLGEVVGLGLRNVAHCPVDLNLMPKSSLKRQQFRQRQPFLIAASFCLILVLWAFGWFFDGVAQEKASALEKITRRLGPLQGQQRTLDKYKADLKAAQDQAEQFDALLEDRFWWAGLLGQLREAMIMVENTREAELKAKAGVWVEALAPVFCTGTNVASARGSSISRRSASSASGPVMDICGIRLKCRCVNLKSADPSGQANDETAFALQKELQSKTNYFEASPQGVELTGQRIVEDLTFTFEMDAKFKRPIRF
jgi:type IV pilus assembly protein PilM